MQSFKLVAQAIPRSFDRFVLVSLALFSISISDTSAAIISANPLCTPDGIVSNCSVRGTETSSVRTIRHRNRLYI